MSRRAIPATGTLVLLAATGCSPDPIDGAWNATTYTYDALSYTLPLRYVYEDGTGFGLAMAMHFDAEALAGEWRVVDTAITAEGEASETRVFFLAMERRARGDWAIAVQDALGLELVCTARETLSCLGTNAQDVPFAFELERATPVP